LRPTDPVHTGAKRDGTAPEDLGLAVPSLAGRARRRAPGLRRSELAARAGISPEYLTRIEQGRDRRPSGAVVNALADALSLDPAERRHLTYLAKISGGRAHQPAGRPARWHGQLPGNHDGYWPAGG
jgi:ribosome-binding protein aMBF1 (putative translation factor)